MPITTLRLIDELTEVAHPVEGGARDFDPLLDLIGNAHFVLLGEASHGTHEFYDERAAITKRLIEEKGFNAVAVEADWPDAYRVNRFVRGMSNDRTASEALSDFKRFPTWMWRNTVVVDFVGWLRAFNEQRRQTVGFYGVDLYSLYASIEAVVGYLEKVDPEEAKAARERYSCFEMFGEDSQAYGMAAGLGIETSCENEVVEQLIELRTRAADYASRDGSIPPDELFYAEQNARLVKNAEEYYRSMYRGRVSSWNLRDRHMTETIEALVDHFKKQRMEPKIVVWEHNSHLGDARATDMSAAGEWNVGQLVRELHGRDAVLVGFTTYQGTVSAADDWDGVVQRKRVRPALPDSYESLFHDLNIPNFLVTLRDNDRAIALRDRRLERAIGVIYRPRTERMSHYFYASLARQFDAVLHFDETRAVEPLEPAAEWHTGEAPETYPFGV